MTLSILRPARLVSFLVVALLGASALQDGSQGWGAVASEAATDTVTFTADVAPILFANCAECHRPGEVAPFPLMSYEDARIRGPLIGFVTGARIMPPWKASPGDYAFRNERRLTPDEIETLARWVEAGMPEGDTATLPPLPSFTEGWQLGPPDLVVSMAEPFPVPADGPDVYRNFVLPLDLDADVWVRAVDFRPSARTVVHHSLFFLDTTGSAREQEGQDGLPGYSSGMGVRLGGFARRGDAARADAGITASRRVGGLGGWAVGGRARELPDGLAFHVPRGADLVLSTHFRPSGEPEREASAIGLYFADGPPAQAFTTIQLPPLFGALEGLDIPAGEPRYTISDSFVLPVDVKAFNVGAHAHYLGEEMRLTATLPGGESKILLWIEDWDFSWQEQYQYADYVSLPAGTRLDVSISYDNSAGNPQNPSTPPVRVTWGEQSTDEMGSVSLQLVTANPGDLSRLEQEYRAHVRRALFTGEGLRQLLRRQDTASGQDADRETRAAEFVERLEESRARLNLSDDQVEQIGPILEAGFDAQMEVLEEHGIDIRDRGATGGRRLRFLAMRRLGRDLDEVREQTLENLGSVLTDEQIETYREIQEERRQEFRERLRQR